MNNGDKLAFPFEGGANNRIEPRFPRFYSFRAIEDMDEMLVVKYNDLMLQITP